MPPKSVAAAASISGFTNANHMAVLLVDGRSVSPAAAPRLTLPAGSLTELTRQPIGELRDPCGTVQRKQCGGGAVTVVGVAHHNWNTMGADHIESVLVGDVVAEVDRHQGSRARMRQMVKNPQQRFPLSQSTSGRNSMTSRPVVTRSA